MSWAVKKPSIKNHGMLKKALPTDSAAKCPLPRRPSIITSTTAMLPSNTLLSTDGIAKDINASLSFHSQDRHSIFKSKGLPSAGRPVALTANLLA